MPRRASKILRTLSSACTRPIPKRGEIVDVTEDEDKAEEMRKVLGELAGKLEPEELKKLKDALAGLAYNRATGDACARERGQERQDGKDPGEVRRR